MHPARGHASQASKAGSCGAHRWASAHTSASRCVPALRLGRGTLQPSDQQLRAHVHPTPASRGRSTLGGPSLHKSRHTWARATRIARVAKQHQSRIAMHCACHKRHMGPYAVVSATYVSPLALFLKTRRLIMSSIAAARHPNLVNTVRQWQVPHMLHQRGHRTVLPHGAVQVVFLAPAFEYPHLFAKYRLRHPQYIQHSSALDTSRQVGEGGFHTAGDAKPGFDVLPTPLSTDVQSLSSRHDGDRDVSNSTLFCKRMK